MGDEIERKASDEKVAGSAVVPARKVGFGLVATGLAISAVTAGWVVYQAKTGAAEIWIPKWAVGGGIVAALVGLLGIVFGPKATSVFENMDKGVSQVKWYEWFVLIATGAAGTWCYYALLSYLETLGYHAK